MAVIAYGDVLIKIGELSRATALTCFRELEFLTLAWLNANVDETTINADIATMLAIASPVTIIQGTQAVGSLAGGAVTVHLPDNETLVITLPLKRETFDALPLSVANLWLEAASRENAAFLDELKKALGRITTIISASQSGNAQLIGATVQTTATTTDGA